MRSRTTRAERQRLMLRHIVALALAGSLSLLVVGAASAEHGSGPMDLYAALSGVEVVGVGHAHAIGEAHLTVDAKSHRVCANIRVRGTGPVTAAHIHRGAAGEVGEIAVTLNTEGFNDANGSCARDVEPEVLEAMRADPGSYYLNIYTLDFPDGAIRGQLQVELPSPSPVMPLTSQVDLQASLNGAKAIPSGDPDGSGEVNLAIIYGQDRICFNIAVEGIEPATSATLHRGAPGEVGQVVADLDPLGFVLWTDGCLADGDITLMDAIARDPGGYYVNVTTDDFPHGAIRGQLESFRPSNPPSPDADGVGSAGGPPLLPDTAAEARGGIQLTAIASGWLLMFLISLVVYPVGRRSLRRAPK